MRTRWENYLADFATTVTLVKISETKDSMNRVTASTETTSTIKADIQWVSKKDLIYLNLGKAQIGDGMLFVVYNADIDLEDQIEYKNERWYIVEEIEGEEVQGNITYKGYVIRRNAQ